MQVISNVQVGKADTSPSKPSHTPGVRQGNSPARGRKQPGFIFNGLFAKGNARRSTGVNAKARNPIDPRSPNLSPA